MFLVLINSILLLIKLINVAFCRNVEPVFDWPQSRDTVNCWTGVAGRRRIKVHNKFKVIMEPFRRNGTSLWTIPTNCGWDEDSVCGHLEDRGGSLYPGRLCSLAWPAWPESLPAPSSTISAAAVARPGPGWRFTAAERQDGDPAKTHNTETNSLPASNPAERRERESSVSFIVWFASQIVYVYLALGFFIQWISVIYPREPLLWFEWGVLPMKQILVV